MGFARVQIWESRRAVQICAFPLLFHLLFYLFLLFSLLHDMWLIDFYFQNRISFFPSFFSGEREWVRHELAPWGISLPPPSLSAQRVTLPVFPHPLFFWTITDSGKEMSSYAFLRLPLRKKGRKKSSNFPRKNFLPSFRECPIIFIIPGGKGRVSPYANPLNSRFLPIFCPFLLPSHTMALKPNSERRRLCQQGLFLSSSSYLFPFSPTVAEKGGESFLRKVKMAVNASSSSSSSFRMDPARKRKYCAQTRNEGGGTFMQIRIL